MVTTHKKKKHHWVLELADSLFIMILCFATLLTAMLLTTGIKEGMDYTIKPASFAAIIMSLGIYLAFVLYHSDKELRMMIHVLYDGIETLELEEKDA